MSCKRQRSLKKLKKVKEKDFLTEKRKEIKHKAKKKKKKNQKEKTNEEKEKELWGRLQDLNNGFTRINYITKKNKKHLKIFK